MKYIKAVLFMIFLVVFDQITKFYFFTNSIDLRYLSLKFTANTGIIFGMLKGYNFIFIILAFFIIALVIYLYIKNPNYSFSLIFVIAGAFGNLTDRIFRGFVVDFIDFGFWPVFNLADMYITIGVFLLIYKLWKEKD